MANKDNSTYFHCIIIFEIGIRIIAETVSKIDIIVF